MKFHQPLTMLLTGFAAVTLAGCSGTPVPAAAPPAAAPTSAPAQAAPTATIAAAAAAPATWADVFPAGAGKQPVLERCGTCHGFDRVVLGQKSADRWNAVKADHVDKVPGMSQTDLDTLFAYLAQNFGPDKPEPNITGLPVTSSAT